MNSDRSLYEVPESLNTSQTKLPQASKRNKSAEDERRPFKPSHPMRRGEGGYISKFLRLEPKEAPSGPKRKRKDPTVEERPNFKYGSSKIDRLGDT